MKFLDTIKSWFVEKDGAPFPFNKIMPYDSMGGEKLYKPFEHSAWVMRAIKKISGPISAVSLDFARNGTAFTDADQQAWWSHPAKGLSLSDLIEATVSWLKLEGEAFWILDDSWTAPFALNRSPMLLARPDKMNQIVKQGQLWGWDYVDGQGNHHALLPQQVVQIRFWNPYSEWRGCSEYRAAKTAAEADYMAGKFDLNLMRSNGDQGVYVICKSGELTDPQRQQVKDQLREKHELATRGIYQTTFLGGDVTVEDPKIRVPDVAFMQGRLQHRHEIFIAFGVPPSMADVQASFSIGSASDYFMLVMETCIPLSKKIAAAIAQAEQMRSGMALTASFNWDEHPVLQAVRRERADTAQKYFQMGVPMSVLNEYLDLKMPEFPGMERGYLAGTLLPVEVEGAGPATGPGPAPEPVGTPEDYEDSVALIRRELGTPARLKRLFAARVKHNNGAERPAPNAN